MLAVGAGGCGFDIFSLVYHFPFSPFVPETAPYRLKYCLKVKGGVKLKTTNKPRKSRRLIP